MQTHILGHLYLCAVCLLAGSSLSEEVVEAVHLILGHYPNSPQPPKLSVIPSPS